MPLDNSPAEQARSLLNGIDYSALIGGPLEAAVKAQAMAARSTWEFIQEVGLNGDGPNREAINVTFLYQKDGELVRLIVPILVIVPIPLIVVDEVNVEFKASINASASSSTEEASSEQIAGELEAAGSIGWGPFSLSARVKASYSSKKDSKATQDSRYSVEYTQDVRVHASQADMPAGLATVLNILTNAATGASRDGDMRVSPPILTLAAGAPGIRQEVLVRLTNGSGLNVPDTPLTLEAKSINTVLAANAEDGDLAQVFVAVGPFGKDQTNLGATNDFHPRTDGRGEVPLLFWANFEEGKEPPGTIEVVVKATVDNVERSFTLPLRVQLPEAPPEALPPPSPALHGAGRTHERQRAPQTGGATE